MERIRQSYDGIKNMVTNVIAFVAGANDDPSNSSLSSGEIVECDSDCSQCCPENQSISLNDSSQNGAAGALRQSCSSLATKSHQDGSQRSKRRKQNSDEGGQSSSSDNKENEVIEINAGNGSKRQSFIGSKSLNEAAGVSKRGKEVSL